jgi:hypothetical protein
MPAALGVHRRLAQLARVHLAQALEAADLDLLALNKVRSSSARWASSRA